MKNKVIGRGTLNVEGMCKLQNVLLHVEGMKANLISIGQLRDEDLVYFDKMRWYLVKEDEEGSIMGTK